MIITLNSVSIARTSLHMYPKVTLSAFFRQLNTFRILIFMILSNQLILLTTHIHLIDYLYCLEIMIISTVVYIILRYIFLTINMLKAYTITCVNYFQLWNLIPFFWTIIQIIIRLLTCTPMTNLIFVLNHTF